VDVTRFLFVRHGETEWNRVLRFRGRADVPLNATGRAQARRVAALAALLGLPLATVWRIGQDNAALSVFERRSGGFVVVSVNDTGHLTPRAPRG